MRTLFAVVALALLGALLLHVTTPPARTPAHRGPSAPARARTLIVVTVRAHRVRRRPAPAGPPAAIGRATVRRDRTGPAAPPPPGRWSRLRFAGGVRAMARGGCGWCGRPRCAASTCPAAPAGVGRWSA